MNGVARVRNVNPPLTTIAQRVTALDWSRIGAELDLHGCAVVNALLSPEECEALVALMLQYGEGDYNCLHQDLYGEHVFPLQVTLLLSKPRQDFTGGEFVITEQRPRMQSRAEVVPLDQGGGVIFPVHYRPVQGTRGAYRVNLRHGVSRVRSGRRHTLGIIFHDAE